MCNPADCNHAEFKLAEYNHENAIIHNAIGLNATTLTLINLCWFWSVCIAKEESATFWTEGNIELPVSPLISESCYGLSLHNHLPYIEG